MARDRLLVFWQWSFYLCLASFSLGISIQEICFSLFVLIQVGFAFRYNLKATFIFEKGRRSATIFFAWILLSAALAQLRLESPQGFDFHWTFAAFWMVAPVLVQQIEWRKLHRILLLLSVPGLIQSGLWLLQLDEIRHSLNIGFQHYPRAEGFVSSTITNAEGLTVLACWSLSRLSQKLQRSERCLILGHLTFSILIVVFSRVRSGLVALTLLFLLNAFLSPRMRKLSLAALALTLSMAIGSSYWFDFNLDSVNERLGLMGRSLELWGNHLLLGIGPDQFGAFLPGAGLPVGHPHNTILGIGTEGGLIGLALYLIFLGCLVARAWQLLRSDDQETMAPEWVRRTLVYVLATYLVVGLFDFNFGDTEVLLLHAFHWALLTQLWSLSRGYAQLGTSAPRTPPSARDGGRG